MALQKLIDDALQKKQDARKDHVSSGKWKPSMLGRCYRAQFWARKNEPITNPPDERVLRIFAAGKLFHDFVQKLIPDSEIEVQVGNEDIFGYADVVDKDTVYDLKSQHSKGFWWMKKKEYDIKKEKYGNWLQVMTYVRLLGKLKGSLVFISKDDLCIAEYTEFLSNWEKELDNEFLKLNGFWKEDKLPDPEPRAYGGKECQYCNWKYLCDKKEKK